MYIIFKKNSTRYISTSILVYRYTSITHTYVCRTSRYLENEESGWTPMLIGARKGLLFVCMCVCADNAYKRFSYLYEYTKHLSLAAWFMNTSVTYCSTRYKVGISGII